MVRKARRSRGLSLGKSTLPPAERSADFSPQEGPNCQVRPDESLGKLRFEQSCGLKSARRAGIIGVALRAVCGLLVAFCIPTLLEGEMHSGILGLRNFGLKEANSRASMGPDFAPLTRTFHGTDSALL